MEWKRTAYRILLILCIVGLVLLVLYALPEDVSPTRGWMQTHLGPPLQTAFGGAYTTITTSAPYVFIASNSILILVVGIIIGIVPISFPVIHGAFNKARGWWVKSAAKESGYPYTYITKDTVMGKPQSVAIQAEEPTPVKSKQEPEPTPEPEPAQTEETTK